MARERIPVRKIREVLRLVHECRLSQREAAAAVRVAPSTVQDYLKRADAAGLGWPLPEDLGDERLEVLLFRRDETRQVRGMRSPEWQTVYAEKRKKGVTLQLLWQEYRASNPDGYSYSRFCELYARWAKRLNPTMRLDHRAGERAYVDYAGVTLPYVDAETGEARDATVFVAVLGASSYTYAEAQTSQDLTSWLWGHVGAFEFWGGVPAVVVIDNLKSGVQSPCRYEPTVNDSYHELAVHYGVAVIPARVRHPRDKSKAESAVQSVERWVIAALRKDHLVGLAGANRAIRQRLDWMNDRPMRDFGRSRRQLFEDLDRPALQPLPRSRFQLALWKKAKVSIDYHVEYDRHYYSVPHGLIHATVDVRATPTTVEIVHRGTRVASHPRSQVHGGHTTRAEHMPESHREYAEWTPARVLRWAGEVGANTARLAAEIMASREHPEQGFRSCMGIVRLSKEYSPERLEMAARRALDHGVLSYKGVRKILDNGLDSLPEEEEPVVSSAPHENLRGSDYYAEGGAPC